MERSLFAQRLKEAREERGYSQAVLGDMIDGKQEGKLVESVYEGGIKLDDEKDTIGWGRGWYNNFTQVPEEIRAVSRPIFYSEKFSINSLHLY